MIVSPTPVSKGPPATAGATDAANPNDSSNKTDIKVALGVGLGVGLPSFLLALLTAWWTRKVYRLKKARASAVNNTGAVSGPGASSNQQVIQIPNGSLLASNAPSQAPPQPNGVVVSPPGNSTPPPTAWTPQATQPNPSDSTVPRATTIFRSSTS